VGGKRLVGLKKIECRFTIEYDNQVKVLYKVQFSI
jgi:hypothetical protein